MHDFYAHHALLSTSKIFLRISFTTRVGQPEALGKKEKTTPIKTKTKSSKETE